LISIFNNIFTQQKPDHLFCFGFGFLCIYRSESFQWWNSLLGISQCQWYFKFDYYWAESPGHIPVLFFFSKLLKTNLRQNRKWNFGKPI